MIPWWQSLLTDCLFFLFFTVPVDWTKKSPAIKQFRTKAKRLCFASDFFPFFLHINIIVIISFPPYRHNYYDFILLVLRNWNEGPITNWCSHWIASQQCTSFSSIYCKCPIEVLFSDIIGCCFPNFCKPYLTFDTAFQQFCVPISLKIWPFFIFCAHHYFLLKGKTIALRIFYCICLTHTAK